MRLLGWTLIFLAGWARAQGLPDPTRPPAAFGSTATVEESADARPQLQSVVMPKEGRPTAVINGRLVGLGERLGNGRLTRLSETEAIIVGPQGTQRLQLTPEAEKVAVQQNNNIAKKLSGKKKEKP